MKLPLLHFLILLARFNGLKFFLRWHKSNRSISKYRHTEIYATEESLSNEVTTVDTIKHRRIRYSGKYPKRFDEKYKEIRGDRDIVEKVRLKGGTPAGQHVPVMLRECMSYLRHIRCK